jgi:hypothetical protein
MATSEGGEDTPMLTAHQYNNPVGSEPITMYTRVDLIKLPPRSRECELGGELPPARISAMVVTVLAGIGLISAAFGWALDAWWPYVAGSAAAFITFKTA